jgi:hypothetical protein
MTTVSELRHYYRPRGSQARLFETRAPEVLLSGPAGTGKSRACLEKIFAFLLKYPGARALGVRKTALSFTSSGLVTWQKQVISEALSNGTVEWYGGSAREPASYRFSNGSVFVVGGMDKPDKVMSTEYDIAYVQEATELTLTDWESILSRLRNGVAPYQQLMGDCNPSAPEHFLYLRAQSEALLMLHTLHTENPLYYDDDGHLTERGHDYIVGKLGQLTGVRRLRLLEGKWVAAEGLVYEEFSPGLHLIPNALVPVVGREGAAGRPVIPEHWPRYWSVDFGYTNPMCVQRWAVDDDGRLIMYRELYATQTLAEDAARIILADVTDRDGTWLEPKPKLIICDHDAEDRATLERHLGLPTRPARKTVSDGIQAVKARLRPAGDGLPRLMIVRDAVMKRDPALVDAAKPVCTADEFPSYVWDTRLQGEKILEEPRKENDHGMDALRYVVAHFDCRAKVRMRMVG